MRGICRKSRHSLPFEAKDTLPAALQAPTAGAGPQTIVLAKARNIPDGNSKPKKTPKTKGPAAVNGCGVDGNLLPGDGNDTEITTVCKVAAGTYNYGFVNIHSGGKLTFADAPSISGPDRS